MVEVSSVDENLNNNAMFSRIVEFVKPNFNAFSTIVDHDRTGKPHSLIMFADASDTISRTFCKVGKCLYTN